MAFGKKNSRKGRPADEAANLDIRENPNDFEDPSDDFDDLDDMDDDLDDIDEDDEEEYQDYVAAKKKGGKKAAVAEAAPEGGKGKRKTTILIVELVLLALVLAGLLGVQVITRMEKVDSVQVEEQVKESISEEVLQSVETGQMKGYRNIAFFGVDSTKGEIKKNTRSDSIMIASINQDTGECKLVSVYRDTYLNLGNDDYNKCNAAYAAGGPEQAIKMLNTNLDMNITDFVTVGFRGLTDAVDALGGIDIEVDSAERPHLNSYQLTMSKELGKTYQEVTDTGVLHLNGLQTTAYCRIRYTAGDDYQRAARQREVLRTIFEKAKKEDPATLTKMMQGILSEVYTSLSATELLELIGSLNDFQLAAENPDDKYGSGFPTQEYLKSGYIGAQSCVIPADLTANVVWLHEYLFEDEDYAVSAKVQECSERISKTTGY
ncbi:MAG: LCP family protein [Lachnospiraceae bacterium]|nr:LCP family protein [Lachnospiraceae bacterium]